ncbi:glutathione hydrolase light chain 1-like isoform X9 [Hemibagrus wyckioides]|uniref:glutathione hydrolase light chain 1-like isoform X9 n=1 Tax=Hemibagrus wyckioides TaxID=337641 RepID=UPI00266C2640|nr:glutathione hydrolase light chain 1-like isoform X9 [Hemibagrus wyckioides]
MKQGECNMSTVCAGKRPLSAMCPTIISDKYNKVKMVVGASGGPRIITATALKAVEEPRFHNQLNPNYTLLEQDFEKSLADGLEQRSHVIEEWKSSLAVVEAVMRQDDKICAESDPRNGGHPTGY